MAAVLYAVLDAGTETAAAVHELDDAGMPQERCRVVAHRHGLADVPCSELEGFETGAAPLSLRIAVLAGAAAGGLGLALGLTGLSPLGPWLTAALTLGVGVVAGAFSGLVAGATTVDPTLLRLATELRPGKVLLSVRPDTDNARERAEHILAAHHAHVVRRQLLPWADPA